MIFRGDPYRVHQITIPTIPQHTKG